jgi:glycosyltransferase involved in cell wall biosynthesis
MQTGSNHLPLVTVVTCTFNGGDLLVDALRSIVEQTYRNVEVLVVDDGSTDGSVERARDSVPDPRVRWIRQCRSGKSVALNRALGEMRGDFYALQDADDESYPRRIERQVEFMLAHPDVAGAFCGYDLIVAGRRVAPNFRFKPANECRRIVDAFHMPGHDPTCLWRRAMVGALRYDESLKIGVGYDYVLRAGEQWPLVVMGELLYSYRVDTAGLTRKNPRERLVYVKEVQRLARLRRGLPLEPLELNPRFSPDHRHRYRDRDNNLVNRFVDSVVSLRLARRRGAALATGLRGAWMHPFDPYYYKPLAAALAPARMLRRRVPQESLAVASDHAATSTGARCASPPVSAIA